MKVRHGYRRTEVGVIPDEWGVLPFDAVFRKVPAKNHQIHTTEYQDSGLYPVVDQGQTPIIGYSNSEDKVFHVPDDGVVIFGDHTCIVKFVKYDFVVGADGTQILTARHGQDPEFHAGALMGRGIEPTGYNRHFKFLKERRFQVPPLPEQRAIAAALSDVDALLGGLDRLIAKKRDLKQAAMQQLLTGRTRLPGFGGEWEVKRLGDVGLTYGGLTGKTKADFGNGDGRYITFMNVMSNVEVDCQSFDRVRVAPSESQNRVVRGDLLFNGSSETPEEVAMCSLLTKDVPSLYLNSFCFGFRLRADPPVDGLFLAYLIRSSVGREVMKSLAQGSTRYNLSKGALLDASIHLPSIDEQIAITTVLSDMDAELAALEARHAKTRDLKQAMMQELLTGNTRLM